MPVTLLLGPMSSEKTMELIRFVERQRFTKKKTVAVKYAKDNRYGNDDALHSHSGASTFAHRVMMLSDLKEEELNDAYHIVIDEGQFFADLEPFVTRWANRGKNIVIAALNGDYLQHEWPVISSMIPKVEYIEKYNAVCVDCGSEEGAFTVKLPSYQSDAIEDIGGADKYKSVCRACLVKMHEEQHKQ